ncbi:MAG: hypothetical protein RL213_2261 [Bacteroidota bacterium]
MPKAPVILFVYNRPDHTFRTLTALNTCEGSAESELHVFCDGPKNADDAVQVMRVRELVRSREWCGKVVLHEEAENQGLQKAIIQGVTRIVNEYGRAIILEDDIVCGKHFLNYCNAALDRYEKDEQVMHINGYMFPHKAEFPFAFFSRYAFVWGWATWKRAWDRFSEDAESHLRKINNDGTADDFDRHGAAGTLGMLQRQAAGTLRTWDVLWYASVFNEGGLCLTPGRSFTRNIGMDGTGANYSHVVKRSQERKIDRLPDQVPFPDPAAYSAANESWIEQVLRDWNSPRFSERLSGKLRKWWNSLNSFR